MKIYAVKTYREFDCKPTIHGCFSTKKEATASMKAMQERIKARLIADNSDYPFEETEYADAVITQFQF